MRNERKPPRTQRSPPLSALRKQKSGNNLDPKARTAQNPAGVPFKPDGQLARNMGYPQMAGNLSNPSSDSESDSSNSSGKSNDGLEAHN